MRWIQTLLVIVVLGAGGLARADEFYDTYQAGMKLFTEKSYPAARAEFQKAYDMRPEPLVLFNIAQTYRLEGNAKEALVYYKRYLTEAKTTDDVRRDAQDYIIQLEEKPKPPVDGPKNPDGTPVRVGEPPMTRPTPPHDEHPRDQPRRRTIPLGSKIAAGVTGAALIYSLITTKVGLGAESDFKELRGAGQATQADADVVARDQKLINIGWGITGAAAITTVVIYFVAPSYATDTRTAIAPTRGGGVLTFARSF